MKKILMVILAGLTAAGFAELDKKAVFGRKVYDRENESTKSEELNAKIYGIYFSAHWCPPCRQFSPVLVDAYNEIQEDGGRFEILFVSSDQTESAMFDYMNALEMPWLAVEFGSDEADGLKEDYDVRGIPKLIIIDADGNLITEDGRADVQRFGAEAYDQWVKKAVN